MRLKLPVYFSELEYNVNLTEIDINNYLTYLLIRYSYLHADQLAEIDGQTVELFQPKQNGVELPFLFAQLPLFSERQFNDLKTYVDAYPQEGLKQHVFYGLVNTGNNHWNAFVLLKQPDKYQVISFETSCGQEHESSVTQLDSFFRKAFGDQVSYRDKGVPQQVNQRTCGHMAVSTLRKILRRHGKDDAIVKISDGSLTVTMESFLQELQFVPGEAIQFECDQASVNRAQRVVGRVVEVLHQCGNSQFSVQHTQRQCELLTITDVEDFPTRARGQYQHDVVGQMRGMLKQHEHNLDSFIRKNFLTQDRSTNSTTLEVELKNWISREVEHEVPNVLADFLLAIVDQLYSEEILPRYLKLSQSALDRYAPDQQETEALLPGLPFFFFGDTSIAPAKVHQMNEIGGDAVIDWNGLRILLPDNELLNECIDMAINNLKNYPRLLRPAGLFEFGFRLRYSNLELVNKAIEILQRMQTNDRDGFEKKRYEFIDLMLEMYQKDVRVNGKNIEEGDEKGAAALIEPVLIKLFSLEGSAPYKRICKEATRQLRNHDVPTLRQLLEAFCHSYATRHGREYRRLCSPRG